MHVEYASDAAIELNCVNIHWLHKKKKLFIKKIYRKSVHSHCVCVFYLLLLQDWIILGAEADSLWLKY